MKMYETGALDYLLKSHTESFVQDRTTSRTVIVVKTHCGLPSTMLTKTELLQGMIANNAKGVLLTIISTFCCIDCW